MNVNTYDAKPLLDERINVSKPVTSEQEVLNRNLPGFNGVAWLVRIDEKHYVISAVCLPYDGQETMAFHSDAGGNVSDWSQVCTVHRWDHEACLRLLKATVSHDTDDCPFC